MTNDTTAFHPVAFSLADLAGEEYVEAVSAARAALTGEDIHSLRGACEQRIDFFPELFQRRLLGLLPQVGKKAVAPLGHSAVGATTNDFKAHTNVSPAPLSGYGYYRIGENGRLYLTTKGEHYHLSLGHCFPGYELLDIMRGMGIPNATHNNTRGHITRLAEMELVRTAAGIPREDRAALDGLLASQNPFALNRVLNLETGSLAAETAIKIALSRFDKPQGDSPEPTYRERIPVLIVIADDDGGLTAGYHGTTIVAQMMRGMWPDLLDGLQKAELLVVRGVKPDDFEQLEEVFERYDTGRYKIAAVFHELVLMNYGARKLSGDFVRRMYDLCARHDVLTVVDEIQTGIWSPELYLYREYGIHPNMAVIGKGFPGGEYPASRILFAAPLDTLPQFGALVTNGQEEIASLAYLVTARWAEANADITQRIGEYYEVHLRELAEEHRGVISAIQGLRHLAGIAFYDLGVAKKFTSQLNEAGIDISVQTYRNSTPPVALTKLPLICGYEVVDVVVAKMREALGHLAT